MVYCELSLDNNKRKTCKLTDKSQDDDNENCRYEALNDKCYRTRKKIQKTATDNLSIKSKKTVQIKKSKKSKNKQKTEKT